MPNEHRSPRTYFWKATTPLMSSIFNEEKNMKKCPTFLHNGHPHQCHVPEFSSSGSRIELTLLLTNPMFQNWLFTTYRFDSEIMLFTNPRFQNWANLLIHLQINNFSAGITPDEEAAAVAMSVMRHSKLAWSRQKSYPWAHWTSQVSGLLQEVLHQLPVGYAQRPCTHNREDETCSLPSLW